MTSLNKLGAAPFVFSMLGHFLFHVLAALYLTIVLSIEQLWHEPYDTLIGLWTLGAFLLGAGAPMAGWLSDRWGESRMMIVYFIGMGAATMVCGLATDTMFLELALGALGLFGAIYHPVGTAWVTKHAHQRGRAMALLGMSGVFGAAAASLVAGLLTDLVDWRVAFAVPGAASVLVGIALAYWCFTGRMNDRRSDAAPQEEPARSDVRRAFLALVTAMSLTTIVYFAFTTVLPKWVEQAIGTNASDGLLGIGAIVMAIYAVGAVAQLLGGHLADRGLAKTTYVVSYGLKFTVLLVAAAVGGWWVIIVAAAIVLMFDLAAPVESVLIARFTSSTRRGLAFGVRNGIAIAAGPLGVQLVAWLWDEDAGLNDLFVALALIVLVITVAACLLPTDRSRSLGSDPGPA